jgi:hypothetical protein
MGPLKQMLATPGGKIAAIAASLFAVGFAVYTVASFMKGDMPSTAFYTTYVCSETGKSFRHKNEMGDTIPIYSPYSGKNTAYPGEACYWNPDGSTKSEPTWVLLNEAVGKNEPTFCPDCGRLVVGHNPRPVAGGKPPPTRGEYAAKNRSSGIAPAPRGVATDR